MQRALQQAFSNSSDGTKVCPSHWFGIKCSFFLNDKFENISIVDFFFRFRQKQYTDLFALAAEDDTSGVGRRGTSGRGRKPPPAKKETNSTNSSNKKNSEPVYNSSDESSEVNEFDYCYCWILLYRLNPIERYICDLSKRFKNFHLNQEKVVKKK